jgi:hypothetical protein
MKFVVTYVTNDHRVWYKNYGGFVGQFNQALADIEEISKKHFHLLEGVDIVFGKQASGTPTWNPHATKDEQFSRVEKTSPLKEKKSKKGYKRKR